MERSTYVLLELLHQVSKNGAVVIPNRLGINQIPFKTNDAVTSVGEGLVGVRSNRMAGFNKDSTLDLEPAAWSWSLVPTSPHHTEGPTKA